MEKNTRKIAFLFLILSVVFFIIHIFLDTLIIKIAIIVFSCFFALFASIYKWNNYNKKK